jgi:hypothetical protein
MSLSYRTHALLGGACLTGALLVARPAHAATVAIAATPAVPPTPASASAQIAELVGHPTYYAASLSAPVPSIPAARIAADVPPSVPAPAKADPNKAPEPFSFADFTWAPANGRTTDNPLSSDALTGELRIDTQWNYSFNRPADNTISGSSEVFRHNELQLTQLGIGGDFHHDNVLGRLMTQFGEYATTTPRNDPSPGRGQWDLSDAYRYISEAYGGYHWDVMNGVNLESGLFMSYIGLWSYYNADNWTYQPSYVSSNTPWFFTGARAQIFPNQYLKIEPWLVNGWQSYGKFNYAPGAGGQILWRPTGWFSLVSNNYVGSDTLGTPDRVRYHTDDSLMAKYYDSPDSPISKAAWSLTGDAGCENGGGVSWNTQYFLGFMAYNRLWFAHDKYAFTLGGGAINNPGRYLVLLPPINGATAFSGTNYFTENPGDPFQAWDAQATFDYMPSQYLTWRLEYNHRQANVPYFSGTGGVTPPGGNQGAPGSTVSGSWAPDLSTFENRISLSMLIKM